MYSGEIIDAKVGAELETTICSLKEGKDDNLSLLRNLKDGRNVSFVNDKEFGEKEGVENSCKY